jgi:hypothetical protein
MVGPTIIFMRIECPQGSAAVSAAGANDDGCGSELDACRTPFRREALNNPASRPPGVHWLWRPLTNAARCSPGDSVAPRAERRPINGFTIRTIWRIPTAAPRQLEMRLWHQRPIHNHSQPGTASRSSRSFTLIEIFIAARCRWGSAQTRDYDVASKVQRRYSGGNNRTVKRVMVRSITTRQESSAGSSDPSLRWPGLVNLASAKSWEWLCERAE